MENFVWDDKYAVGIKEIDEQHKKLVELINDLNEAIYTGQGCQKLETVFKEVIDYTITHFSFEEDLLRSNDYPDIMAHEKKHKELTKEAMDLQEQFEGGNFLITMQVMNFLKDWLVTHILEIDKKYETFLKDKGVT